MMLKAPDGTVFFFLIHSIRLLIRFAMKRSKKQSHRSDRTVCHLVLYPRPTSSVGHSDQFVLPGRQFLQTGSTGHTMPESLKQQRLRHERKGRIHRTHIKEQVNDEFLQLTPEEVFG